MIIAWITNKISEEGDEIKGKIIRIEGKIEIKRMNLDFRNYKASLALPN